jgi:hypothetical protein
MESCAAKSAAAAATAACIGILMFAAVAMGAADADVANVAIRANQPPAAVPGREVWQLAGDDMLQGHTHQGNKGATYTIIPTMPSPDTDATKDNHNDKPQRTTLLAFATNIVVLVLWAIGAWPSHAGDADRSVSTVHHHGVGRVVRLLRGVPKVVWTWIPSGASKASWMRSVPMLLQLTLLLLPVVHSFVPVSFGGSSSDYAYAIALDATGGAAYVTGYFESTDMTVGTTTLTNQGSYDVFLAKVSTTDGSVSFAVQKECGSGKKASGTVCVDCGAGTYKNGTDTATSCSGLCPDNSDSPKSSDELNDCVAVAGYTGQGAGVIACSEGTYKAVAGSEACTR